MRLKTALVIVALVGGALCAGCTPLSVEGNVAIGTAQLGLAAVDVVI